LRQRHVYLAWFAFHFLLIVAGSCRDTLWLIAHDLTILPNSVAPSAQKAEHFATAVLAQNLPVTNPVRRAVFTYLHIAGVERGYGYFAPNVPASYKLVFELRYPDGRVEYRLPRVHSAAAGLRLAGLLDEIARTRYDRLREYLIKSLALSVWSEHPDATTIRAVFGSIIFPGINQFERGERESYKFLYAYDFSRDDGIAEPKEP
jgi:hypothetical protein